MSFRFFLITITIASLNTQSASAADTLIKEYVKATRIEPYGVDEVGYPQVCMRVNLNEKIDMQGVMNELIDTYPADQLITEATKLAGSGYLGHVWTLFFDTKDSWRSWSFRKPNNPLGDALNHNHFYDSPSRAFTYQYCVSAKGKNIETKHLLDNQIKNLINESREIASSMMPDVSLPDAHGIYTPLTPCVWFAVKLFNAVMGENIPYEQPINGKEISNIMNNPVFERIDLTVDASTVYEALSKQIKFAFGMSDTEQYMFLKNNNYLGFFDEKASYLNPINKNSFYDDSIEPFIKKAKTAMLTGTDLYIIDSNGLFSIYSIKEKKVKFKNMSISFIFDGTVINPRKIKSTMPLYKGMPGFDNNKKKHLVFTIDGEVYLAVTEERKLIKTSYFDTNYPEISKYTNRIVGSSAIKDGNIFIYLTKGKFIEVNRNTMEILGGEKDMREHPVLGDYFKLQ